MPLSKTSNYQYGSSNETVLQHLTRQQNEAEANQNQSNGFESNNQSELSSNSEGPTKKKEKRKRFFNGDIVQDGEKVFWGVLLLKEDALMLEQVNLQLLANGVIINIISLLAHLSSRKEDFFICQVEFFLNFSLNFG